MSRTAYFDLASGASGDMIIAAVADAGRRIGSDAAAAISDAVASLGLGCSIEFLDDERGGLACLRAEVKTDGSTHTPQRLRAAIEHADVSRSARDVAMNGLDALVDAEATVHGIDIDEVHLHELGSADTAADLIGAAVAIEVLGVSDVWAAPVPMPTGWIESRHGALPLPAPATLKLLEGAPVRGVEMRHELVTPTGAAILVAHRARFGPLPELTLEVTGVGGGKRATQRPNVCRVLIGSPEPTPAARLETCVLLETNIDDQTPEALGNAVETLIEHGALDAWVTPIVMKKTRPAFLLSVLVQPRDEVRITESLFLHTTTLGVRRRETTRWTLERSELVVRIEESRVRVKIATLGDRVVNVAPQFSDCVEVSDATGVPVKDIYERAVQLARRALARGE